VSGLSVVIASHDAALTLGAQLDALCSQRWPRSGEIIVADNRSSDDTCEVIDIRRSHSPITIRRVAVDDAPGAAHARNIGVQHASHSQIAFCDADDVVGPNWVAAMTDALTDHDFVGGPHEYERLNPAWLAQARGRSLAPEEPSIFEGRFPIVSSSNMGITRSTFDAVEGFDVGFRRAHDADLSLRLWQRGVDAHHCPSAVVHYRMRTTDRALFSQSRSWGRQAPILRQRSGVRTDGDGRMLRSWLWLATRTPTLFSRANRARWMHVAGTRIGDLEGRLALRRGSNTNGELR